MAADRSDSSSASPIHAPSSSTPTPAAPEPARDQGQGRGRPLFCAWCGREMARNHSGRRRKYCCQSCRQRAYEQRALVKGTAIEPDAVIFSAEVAERLHDELYELRCAAEDVRTAVGEGCEPGELQGLADELVEITRRIEHLRGQR